jgi:crotonobetainyl-CoA:carnitine CoA-transferase CaiB-like acyl-CoA transferase
MAVLDEIIAGWTRAHASRELLDALHKGGVPCGLVYQPADMISDPHFRARRSLVEVEDPEHGSIVMPAVVPRLSETPGRVRWAGPELGEHTDAVLREAGLTDPDVERLRAAGVV